MNAELVLFGRRIDMARQRRRRVLVVAMYSVFAVLMAVLWYFTHWRGSGAYVIWAGLLACRLFLGGYYKGGLVKPFQPPRPEKWNMPSGILELKLRMYLQIPQDEETAWRNDERELHQRDHAHYLAFQAVAVAVAAPMLLATMRILRPHLFGWDAAIADQAYYTLLMIVFLLVLTLPQAILLWSEPDMQEE